MDFETYAPVVNDKISCLRCKNKFSIDVENSINSGQVFLWEKNGNYWYGINGQDILQVYNENGVIKSIPKSKLESGFF